ncbi:flavin reductase family protein [Streptomonospora alba]|uniref:flavin reductase family protein n=1 Tax=Streptomonospora alba TaxID=183763 RepID=UPI000699B0DF|nr:flavin reductase family protein [Streptomonospora alba]
MRRSAEAAVGSDSGHAERLPREGDVAAEGFRRVMGEHAAGVVVVTAEAPHGPVGVTATSFTSVSLDPPLVSFYIDDRSSTWQGLRQAPSFAVNILGEDQQETASRFAARGIDRFAPPTRWQRGPDDLPLLHGAAGHLLCRKYDVLAVGDHWLVVGRVAHSRVSAEADRPLVYHRGRYGGFSA